MCVRGGAGCQLCMDQPGAHFQRPLVVSATVPALGGGPGQQFRESWSLYKLHCGSATTRCCVSRARSWLRGILLNKPEGCLGANGVWALNSGIYLC